LPLAAPTLRALEALHLPVEEDAPLASRVYWRVGGPADGLVEANDLPALQGVVRAATETDCPLFVLGRGSNLLVSDAGVRGLVVVLGGALADTEDLGGDPPAIRAGAGLSLTVLLSRAQRAGWTGLECFAGIPGTVGGAVVMNAGSQLGETVQPLVDADVVLPDGSVRTLSKAVLRMSYRTTHLPEGAVVASARLQTSSADPDETFSRVRAFLARRKATQPLTLPSCGSTFRNPPGDHAGRLIEAAGLEGYRLGDAQVSEKHANFVVNHGAATAAQLRRVIEHVQDTVQARFGVRLQREVRYAGDWAGWAQQTTEVA